MKEVYRIRLKLTKFKRFSAWLINVVWTAFEATAVLWFQGISKQVKMEGYSGQQTGKTLQINEKAARVVLVLSIKTMIYALATKRVV